MVFLSANELEHCFYHFFMNIFLCKIVIFPKLHNFLIISLFVFNLKGKPEDSAFSLDIGAGLMLHLAWCKSEFPEITEIHSQMETFLQEMKHIVEWKNAWCFRQSSNSYWPSASDFSVVLNTSKDLSPEICVTFDQDGSMLNMLTLSIQLAQRWIS